MTVYDRIKKLAQKKGKSMQAVAEDNGFSSNLFYRWKKSDPKGKDLAKLADYFNTTVDYLLGRTENPNPNSSSDNTNDIEWSDLGMAYGGKIPKDLEGMYKAIAQQYVKDHPESIKKDDD